LKISEIAQLAGVSIGTVDRVLHNRGRVAPQTKAKIEKIIQESGYHTNIIASNLKKGQSLKIGILIPFLNSEEGYWAKCYKGIKKSINEISAFSVEIETREFDRMLHGDLVEKGKQLIDANVDVVAFAPVVQSESYQLITMLGDIPYAFFDSSLKSAHPITENLQDAYAAGYCAGKIMELLKPGKRTFVCLQMHKTAYNQQRRAQGFCDYFQQKDSKVLLYTWSESIDDMFFAFIDSLINEIPDVDGLFMTNAATGILSDYLAKKLKNKLPSIVGFDLIGKNVEELKNGNISSLISQQPDLQGYNTLNEIFRIMIMKQADTVPTSPIPISVIFKENIPSKTFNY
jgi:LacI family transcriptional regulator